jgi:hypothetical protein
MDYTIVKRLDSSHDWGGEFMYTIRCIKCEKENPREFANCKYCGTELVVTGELEISDAEKLDLAKAKPMQSPDTHIDEIDNPHEDNLSQKGEDGHKSFDSRKTDSTIEAPIIDTDALLALEALEDEHRNTEQLPEVDDEESVLRIGSVRFRGDLVLRHQDSGKDFIVKNEALQEVVIGRIDRVTGFSPMIDLTDIGGKVKGVSRRHATIGVRGDLLVITDHSSMNGTFLNGQRLVPEQARVLRDSDILRIGHIQLLIYFRN